MKSLKADLEAASYTVPGLIKHAVIDLETAIAIAERYESGSVNIMFKGQSTIKLHNGTTIIEDPLLIEQIKNHPACVNNEEEKEGLPSEIQAALKAYAPVQRTTLDECSKERNF